MKSTAFTHSVTAIASAFVASFMTMGIASSVQAQNAGHLQELLAHRTCQRCELSGIAANGVNLRGSFLDVADLRKSSLSGATLAFSTMYYADFRGADLSNSDLRNTFLIHSDLIKVNLSGANARNSRWKYADLTEANLQNSNLIDIELVYAKLNGANLANLRSCTIQEKGLQKEQKCEKKGVVVN
ncbi:MAG: pentapeptide repeat-containing protein [Pseudanabaena sp. LacPavin_0818_WC45_MAG_42_6]|nr:pentapeptide repeat-containing protein [Pseudanabaena sp. LacPavin_0818_WC45_MAG_42_6]